MAKKIWDDPIDFKTDWGGDENTEGLPVSGKQVQKLIKDTFNSKVGIFYYDPTNNRYLVFANEDTRDAYLADTSKTEYILGTFDAPFNYSAEINLLSNTYNAVQLGTKGHYIDFTFDIKNKQGSSTGENVTIKYTFIRNSVTQEVTQIGKYGDRVHFNVDNYIGEGTNTIIVGITGQSSLAATTVAITYQVVNLTISDELDISKAYNLTEGPQTVEVPFTVSGYGTKIVEWYIDGNLLDPDLATDEITNTSATRTKYIQLSGLNQGVHSLQIRAYVTINGDKFYTDTLYHELIVYTGVSSDLILGISTIIPKDRDYIKPSEPLCIYGLEQYVPYSIKFATYSPRNLATSEVLVYLDNMLNNTVSVTNNTTNIINITSSTAGEKVLEFVGEEVARSVKVLVQPTSMNIQEINDALVYNFDATKKSNSSSDRDIYNYGEYTGTLEGFSWNDTSGWVNGRLEINKGASFSTDFAPLLNNTTTTGRTIEIEWSTKNVLDPNAIICDLRDSSGVGLVIRATKVSLISNNGVVIETEYKSRENVRIAFVINRKSGTTNKRLSFIYCNGIISRADQWIETDSYNSNKCIKFLGSEGAEVSLKSIRVYNSALSSNDILNNYILYRDSIEEMLEVYNRNDIYEEDNASFSLEKMMNRLPVMVITGDIPILENTSDKDTQITVDVEFYNIQDSTKSFTIKNAAMRPQGTSSMGYPKKNFRIYTQKLDSTKLYDSEGNEVPDKLWSFKDKAQPVNCWCLKADYAESSGTHNTGIARMWNKALYDAKVTINLGEGNEHNADNVSLLRTGAQIAAINANYPYDVRTTIDGFPILLFYKLSKNDDLKFIGKYNFNNDKSTESVFGFKDIPGFVDAKMQCWEVLTNGNPLALFTSVEDFDTKWSDAFESRYPDTKTPNTTDLKAFCEWMVNVSQEDFRTQKWEHLNVYMMAAYWIYLMRHAGADQFVKNAMFTSEDGQHFYYILYDNDTINGLINSGYLRISSTDTRQTVDDSGAYVFAGHDSRLWNMLEADEEFNIIVSQVDNALYSAGISYEEAIKTFDISQADKWVEKVYNKDAEYKYLSPFIEKGTDNLFMLQGKRDLHRKWWLAERFSIYDAKYITGPYKSQAVEIKCLNGTTAGQQFTIQAGYPLDYGYEITNGERISGISLSQGEEHTFTTNQVLNIGDPLRIFGAHHLAKLDISPLVDRVSGLVVSGAYNEVLGSKLRYLILGNSSKTNNELSEISGLASLDSLEYLDIQGMKKMVSIDLTEQKNLKTLKAYNSAIASVIFAKGAPVENVELPDTIKFLQLTELPVLSSSNLSLAGLKNIQGINISKCPNLTNDFSFIKNWYNSKTTEDSESTLILDNVDWEGVDANDLINISKIGTLNLKGTVYLSDIDATQLTILMDRFGETAFQKGAEFFINAPSSVFILGKTEILEGDSEEYKCVVFNSEVTGIAWSMFTTQEGVNIDTNTGILTTSEGITSNITVSILARVTTTEGIKLKTLTITIIPRVYPSSSKTTIVGNTSLENTTENYSIDFGAVGITGNMIYTWTLEGLDGYATIKEQNGNTCVLEKIQEPLTVVMGTLSCEIKRRYDNTVLFTVTKELSIINDIVAEADAGIVGIFYDRGLCANSSYITKEEAKLITDDLFLSAITGNTHSAEVKTFNGFKWFTSITTIPDGCFYGWMNLTSIEIPNSVVSILGGAFLNCIALKEIELPSEVETIGENCFGNSGIKRLNIPNKVVRIPRLGVLSNLEYFEIGSGLTTISSNTFTAGMVEFVVHPDNMYFTVRNNALYSKDLKTFYALGKCLEAEYTILEGVETIKEYAFDRYLSPLESSLVTITLPNSVKIIERYAFRFQTKLTNVVIPEGVTTIGSGAFTYTRLTKINIPSNVEVLGDEAFSNCTSLQEVVFTAESKLETLNSYTFYNCTSLESIVLPDNLSKLKLGCFMECYNLKEIGIPKSCISIAVKCFSGCSKLENITCWGETAPTVASTTFGESYQSYVGTEVPNGGSLLTPETATGYDTGAWADVLCNPDKCNFTLIQTL